MINDFSMCINPMCPLASQCFRHTTKDEGKYKYQSMTIFNYYVTNRGPECDYFWPLPNQNSKE